MGITVMTSNRPRQIILDCSLRDGGYYNNWDFPLPLVHEYLATMGAVPVDVIEIGLRDFSDGTFKGAHAFSTDDYLRNLPLPEGPAIAVMVNAKSLLTYPGGCRAAVDALFAPCADSPVAMVRVAAHVKEVAGCGPIIDRLVELGYRVGLNIMQVGQYSTEALSETVGLTAGWPLEVLYFADSLGNMDAAAVTRVLDVLRNSWSGAVGIHTHDNMMNALSNSMAAVAMGVRWVDGTVLGIGRGPGNVRLEYLLMALNRTYGTGYQLARLIHLLDNHFIPYQRAYGWGPHPLYYISAQEGIHPTYVQDMMADPRYDGGDILEAMRYLSTDLRHSFKASAISELMLDGYRNVAGRWTADGWTAGKDVLLVAPGDGAYRYNDALADFIDRKQPTVIMLNVSDSLDSRHISAYLCCHPQRILMDAQHFLTLERPLIVPLDLLPEAMREPLRARGALDYGINIETGTFAFGADGCTLPYPLAAAYALAVATRGGGRRILLAGFDGFDNADPRQTEMAELFDLYQRTPGALPLLAITPAGYAVPHASIYAPDL